MRESTQASLRSIVFTYVPARAFSKASGSIDGLLAELVSTYETNTGPLNIFPILMKVNPQCHSGNVGCSEDGVGVNWACAARAHSWWEARDVARPVVATCLPPHLEWLLD